MYLSTYEELEGYLDLIKGTDVLAIDTEFHSEKTYYAQLCLLQLGTAEAQAIVDPLAIGDLSPLVDIFLDESVTKVFHSGRQDLAILYREVGVVPHPIFDTQIAAGLLGYAQQMGYGPLVQAFCDVKLPKADSFTDWTRRPLSKTQVAYALDDVVYLPRIYRDMERRLRDSGRLEWLQDDFEELSNPTHYEIDNSQVWRKVKRVSSLTRKQLAVAQVVAAWRERTAQRKNLPRKWVLTDELIIEIARRAPRTVEDLLEVRGSGEQLNRHARGELVSDICAALNRDPDTWPKTTRRPKARRESEGVVDLMLAILHMRAREAGVASQFIANKDDLVRLSKGDTEDLAILSGWRRKLAGDEMLSLLAGEISISVENGTLKVMHV